MPAMLAVRIATIESDFEVIFFNFQIENLRKPTSVERRSDYINFGYSRFYSITKFSSAIHI